MNQSVRPGAGHYLGLGATGIWTMLSTLGVYTVAWGVEQTRLQTVGTPLSGRTWLIISLVQALLVLVVTIPLALLVVQPVMRAIYRAWSFAAGAVMPLALVRLMPPFHHEETALLQAAVALALTVVLWLGARVRGQSFVRMWSAAMPALAAGAVVLLPWLVYGALGSWQESVTGALACLALGLLVGVLVDIGLLRPLAAAGGGPGLAGAAAGLVLLLLGTGFALPPHPLLVMFALPPLGWGLVALGWAVDPSGRAADGEPGPSPLRRAWLPTAVLTAAGLAGPVLFTDPGEMNMFLSDALGQDFRVMLLGAAGAALLALLWPLRMGLATLMRRPAAGAAALVLTMGGALTLQLWVGQPGFYGDRYLVVLRDQADVSAAERITARTDRLRMVYSTLTRQAEQTQAPLRQALDRLHVPYTPYYLVNALEVQAGPLVRHWLASRPEVARVVASPRLRPLHQLAPVEGGGAPVPHGPVWNLEALGAPKVWQELGVTGRGIVIGQSDSGVDGQHPALRAAYRGVDSGDDYNWLDPWYHTKSPVDYGGHGTHTLGTVLGSGGIGVAPGSQWFGCSNLARNLGAPALYLDCLQFMLAPYPQSGDPFHAGDPARAAHVLNNSWGCPPIEGCEAGTLEPAVRALRAAGIFVVVSAGNEGPACSSVSDPLAIYPEVFSVGAVDKGGDIAGFSSRGPVMVDGSGRVKPDIVAPGVSILSAWPGGAYAIHQGTSMAGPHVAGVVALMWSAQPKLVGNIARTEQLLQSTAKPYTGKATACGNPQNVSGHGVVDAYAAVKAALAEK